MHYWATALQETSLFYLMLVDLTSRPELEGAFRFLRAGFQAFFAEETVAVRHEQQGEAAHEVFRSEFRNFVSDGGRAETEIPPNSSSPSVDVARNRGFARNYVDSGVSATWLAASLVEKPFLILRRNVAEYGFPRLPRVAKQSIPRLPSFTLRRRNVTSSDSDPLNTSVLHVVDGVFSEDFGTSMYLLWAFSPG